MDNDMVEKKTATRKKSADVIAGLVARIDELEERVTRLEAARDAAVANLVAPPAPAAARAAAAAPVREPADDVSEDILLVIAASVAAFLGERAHVRQVRLVASEAWAHEGRVSVMASHVWGAHR